jgi:NitT/TauT family transport system ATP-binding protein
LCRGSDVIRIANASKVFTARDGHPVDALTGIDLSIEDNEFVSLVGPSGCGKSTLLRLVAGLVPSTSGAIEIDSSPVTEPRRDTAIVFQRPTVLPWASVVDNGLFPLKVMDAVEKTSHKRALELLKLVGLAGFERKFPRELSGGMQQRASICRALIHEPQILLMDEPFGALDALTREEMSLELLRIWTDRRKTILFVTHSIPEAILLSDRVVVMSPRPGRIAEILDVPLPRPRSFAMEGDAAFQTTAQRIRNLIFDRHD